ncbi:hypothetical protein WMW72_12120 [Paenibacillus filicis]|uniref:Tail fiber protein n=1 Tax=Paenibacillus filicis TaxID=669464 RepID=A0ABU9DLK7_9BACL
MRGMFDNGNITTPTYTCEVGLFALDPQDGEILYSYANAGTQGDTIPPISSGPLSKQFQLNAAIGNASNVTATVVPIPALHGPTHVENGTDPIPNATSTVGGLMSAADKKDLTTIKSQLKDGLTITSTLKHGPQVITTDQAGPARVTVQGRTLQNILVGGDCESLTGWTTAGTVLDTTIRRYGDASFKMFGSTGNRAAYKEIDLDAAKTYVAAVDVYVTRAVTLPNIAIYDKGGFANAVFKNVNTTMLNQWQTVYVKFTGRSGVRLLLGKFSGTDDFDAYFDGASLYEVDAATYAAIGTTITDSNIRDYLPHINGMQSVQCPAVLKTGKNPLPPFAEWTNLHPNATISGPYVVNHAANGTGQVVIGYSVPVVSGQTYTFSATLPALGGIYVRKESATGAFVGGSTSSPYSFTADASYNGFAFVYFSTGTATGNITFSNPILVLGTTADLPQSFEARNDDYVIGVSDSDGKPLKLAGDPISGVYDSLYWRDAWYKYKRWETDKVLRGSNITPGLQNKVGYKIVTTPLSAFPSAMPDSAAYKAARFDGRALTPIQYGNITGPDCIGSGSSGLGISISNTDSGFSDATVPTANELVALFNGWQAKTLDANGKPTAWRSLLTQSDAPTQTLAYVSTNEVPGWPGYLTMIYQRAQGVEEAVTVEGSISMHTGGNLVELTEGVIVREKVTPALSGSTYFVNNLAGAKLSRRANAILSVYKGGDPNRKWTIAKRSAVDAGLPTYGYGYAQIPAAELASTNDVYVTYLALDKQNMTAAATDGRIEYPGNPGSAIGALSQSLDDNWTRDSVQDWQLILAAAYSENNARDIASHRTAPDMDHPDKSVRQRHLADGAVTDAAIGSRTANDTTAPTMTGPLGTLLSSLFSLIKGITGKASATSAPRTTLENAVKRDGDTMTGSLTVPNVLVTTDGDAILGVEDTGAPSTSFRRKLIYASRNVLGGDGWLFRQQKPSDGGILDYRLSGPGGDIMTTGNSIQFRLNAGVLESWNGSGWQPVGAIKSIQKGVSRINSGSSYVDVTITQVDINKSGPRVDGSVLLAYQRPSGGDVTQLSSVTATFLDNKTVRITYMINGSAANVPNAVDVQWSVTEYL